MRAPLLALPLIVTSCLSGTMADTAARDEAGPTAVDEELRGFRAEETQPCLPVSMDSTTPRIVDDRHIVYPRTHTTQWVTTLDESCPGLRPTSTLIVERFGDRTCRLDIVRPVNGGGVFIPGARCALGAFTRYERIAR